MHYNIILLHISPLCTNNTMRVGLITDKTEPVTRDELESNCRHHQSDLGPRAKRINKYYVTT